ncbi:hypothetical protein BN1708_020049, partial [Verticillium longisporum]
PHHPLVRPAARMDR